MVVGLNVFGLFLTVFPWQTATYKVQKVHYGFNSNTIYHNIQFILFGAPS
jgi:hypothetical protein